MSREFNVPAGTLAARANDHDAGGSPPRVSQCWLLLAVMSIGLAALAAVALVLARTPLLTALVAPDTFPRALVVHVNFATLIWYFAMACALWTERLHARRLPAAAVFCVLGCASALAVAWSGGAALGVPVLVNYVPYLDSVLFKAALGCFAAAALATAMLSLRRPRDAAEWGFALARWPFVMAALYLALRLGAGDALVDALWGAGHILQFGFVTLLMAIWQRLVERGGGAPLPTTLAIVLFAAAALPATVAPLVFLSGATDDAGGHALHTSLMRSMNWPAVLLFGALLLYARPVARRVLGFIASFVLLLAGCLAGLAIEHQTTLIPAHYHGTIGAFTLALMAAVLSRLPTDRGAGLGADGGAARVRAPSRLPLALYASGSLVLIAGLGWSGLLGAPRKTPFSAEGADLAVTLSAALTGLGGAITIAGIVFFVIVAVPGIFRLCIPHPLRPHPANQQDRAPTFAAVR